MIIILFSPVRLIIYNLVIYNVSPTNLEDACLIVKCVHCAYGVRSMILFSQYRVASLFFFFFDEDIVLLL